MSSADHFYLAPLQGATDFVYRKIYHQLFGDIDAYYIPYISLGSGNKIRNSQIRDLLPENNHGIPVVPQILCANSDELRQLAQIVKDYGYSKLNINMGCPYPMATNRGRGSALLQQADELKRIFDCLFSEFDFQVSVKFRAGMEDEQDIFKLTELLQAYPFTELIFHPRTAKQLYKGSANRSLFAPLFQDIGKPLVYNGDIATIADIEEIRKLVPNQDQWMIGRGVLANPFLISELKGKELTPNQKQKLKLEFHQLIFDEYQSQFVDQGQLLMKLKAFWSYFANSFTNPHKAFKPIKKASNMAKYNQAYPEVFNRFSE